MAAGSPLVAESLLGLRVVLPVLAFEPLRDRAGSFLKAGSFLGGRFEGIGDLLGRSVLISIISGFKSASGLESISIISGFGSTCILGFQARIFLN